MLSKIKYAVFLAIFLLSVKSWAIPPSEINLEYDSASKILHIQIIHVTTNIRDHHIRAIEIYKNDQSINTIRLVTQNTSREIIQDVSVDAKGGDVIKVKAICSEKGNKELSLTVVEEESAKEENKDAQTPEDVLPLKDKSLKPMEESKKNSISTKSLPPKKVEAEPKPSSSSY